MRARKTAMNVDTAVLLHRLAATEAAIPTAVPAVQIQLVALAKRLRRSARIAASR